jgi:ketosteroid isomerase-like protein
MSDPIKPPAARRPEEALELVSQALSDGDLEAALAQYEKTALLACWPGTDIDGDGDVRDVLTEFMALRLPLAVRIVIVLESPELALVVCERRVAGVDQDGKRVRLTGYGSVMLRSQPDASWRIAADVWQVGPEVPPVPPEIPPGTRADAVPDEVPGGQPHHLKP